MKYVWFTVGAVWAIVILSNGRIDSMWGIIVAGGCLGMAAGLLAGERI